MSGSDLAGYFLDTTAAVAALDLFEITHPNFSQPYRFVPKVAAGVTVDLSPTELAATFQYVPADITPPAARDDTDASVKVTLGDIGETIATEMDNVAASCGFLVKPQVRYWLFRSDSLSAPLVGPLVLEVDDIEFGKDGATFEATAPQLNARGTGERYSLDRFPMLRGFTTS